MSKIDIIIYLLNHNNTCFASEIASSLNIGLDKVLKIVKEVNKAKEIIKIEPNFRLILKSYDNDIDGCLISSLLNGDNYNVKVVDNISSTNTYLKENSDILPTPYLLVSKNQEGGRGRHNRSFFCYDGGLYFSILLNPNLYPHIDFNKDATFITAISALALIKAIKKVSNIDTSIKWVNDIYLNGKKVSGILAEGISKDGYIDKYILGIGMNVNKVELPLEIRDSATYLSDNNVDRNVLLALFVNELDYLLDNFNKRVIRKEYSDSLFIKNKVVTIHNLYDDSEYNALVIGVNKKLELIIKVKGKRKVILNDEVRIKIGDNND